MAHAVAGKLFNDPVHGHVELHPLLVHVLDTTEFQRLRDLTQLGGVQLVFPGASHRRFEHSIGVAHLARVFMECLTNNQGLEISERDRICVQIASLCHDLGHGPYSHMFETKFINVHRRKQRERRLTAAATVTDATGATGAAVTDAVVHDDMEEDEREWSHEQASVALFERLVYANNLVPHFQHYGLEVPTDLRFIQRLILGTPATGPEDHVARSAGLTPFTDDDRQRDTGRDFLFDILANKRCGLDVDRFDYLARDCKQLGVHTSFDAMRLMRFAAVCEVEDGSQSTHLHICFLEKELWNAYEIFHNRFTLYRRAYQHRVANCTEEMIASALHLANEHLKFPGDPEADMRKSSKNPRVRAAIPADGLYTLADSVFNMDAYKNVSDWIVRRIESSFEPELKPARELLMRLRRRQLFPFAGEVTMSRDIPATEIHEQLWRELQQGEHTACSAIDLQPEQLIVLPVKVSYGMGNINPVSRTAFFRRSRATNSSASNGVNTFHGEPVEVGSISDQSLGSLLPVTFEDRCVRVMLAVEASRENAARASTEVHAALEQWSARVGAVQLAITPQTKRSRGGEDEMPP